MSIDGPRDLHDAFRVDRKGRATFGNVMRGIVLLKNHSVRFNTLTKVNRVNAKRPLDVYRFLRNELGSTYIQFIPCVQPKNFHSVAPQHWPKDSMPMLGSDGAKPGYAESVVTEWSVDPDDWGYFLSRTFDEWHKKDVGRVLVNLFETAVVQIMGRPAQTCVTAEFCGKALAIEHATMASLRTSPREKLNIGRITRSLLALSGMSQPMPRGQTASCSATDHLSCHCVCRACWPKDPASP